MFKNFSAALENSRADLSSVTPCGDFIHPKKFVAPHVQGIYTYNLRLEANNHLKV